MRASALWAAAGLALAAGSALAQGGAGGNASLPRPVVLCANCHGVLGLGNTPDAPHLAGQPKVYLLAQLKAFRSGTRKHEVMNVIAKPLTDEEIETASDWFAGVLLEVRRP
jgi:cytochrome c553